MKLYSFLIVIFSGYSLCQVVNNVRLRDHTSYMIDVITKTVNIVEERGWCNLKLPDHVQALNEMVINTPLHGTVRYTNGFLVSMQHVDIQQSTVQQVWFYNTTSLMTTVSVRGTLRLHDVAVGFDVEVDLNDGNRRYTTIYTHPLISYAFSIIKNVFTDAIEVTVIGTVPNTVRIPVFRPVDNTTDILTSTFNPATITSAGIHAWGSEVLQPLAYDIATQQVPFPTFCYNCAT